MDLDKGKVFDLIAMIVIAVVGLFTAYITFGILESQAEAKVQQYSVGGAIAGALISFSLLASVYLQIRKSSGELEELRKQNKELEQKIIRGAPRPTGFETEVAERQRIVIARPRAWEPRGGIIFDFELPESVAREKEDVLPARFTCSFVPITSVPITSDIDPHEKYYMSVLEGIVGGDHLKSYSKEYIYLGGEIGSVRSLKIISTEYAKVSVWTDRGTGKVTRYWRYISKDELEEAERAQTASTVAEPPSIEGKEPSNPETGETPFSESTHALEIMRMQVFCYQKELGLIFFFDFVDDANDFIHSSTVFNQILGSTRFLI